MSKERLFNIHYNIPQKSSMPPNDILEDIINKSNKFEKIIDKQVQYMKKQGMDINSCLEYLNSIIEEYTSQLLNRLNLRFAKRNDSVNKLFNKRSVDKKELEEMLREITASIKHKKAEYNFLIKIYNERNPFVPIIENEEENEDA